MREEEKKEAEKEDTDEDACFRGCCRVLKTTNRGTDDDDETNVFPKMTFRLAKDLVNVNAMMTSMMASSLENTTDTTSNTTTTNKAGKKNQRNKCIKMSNFTK